MKKFLLLITLLLTLSSTTFAQEETANIKMPTRFQSVPMDKAQLLQTGQGKMFCPSCGMTLPVFYKTNHAVESNGTVKQYCSIHCLATNIHKHNLKDIKVVDNTSLKFIDANSAWYVVGSTKAGTMSRISKYAFSSKKDAQSFAKKFSGEVKTFEETLKFVQENLAKAQKMIAKKQAMMAKKGEMMFGKICKPTEKLFSSVAEAKSYLKTEEICGKIKGKKLQAIALYLTSRSK
jgi:Skp family chaperone for outer membrane proteins